MSEQEATYAVYLDAAARRACAGYLDAIGMQSPARQFAEYDALTDEGRQAWRKIVLRAVYDMLPVVLHIPPREGSS